MGKRFIRMDKAPLCACGCGKRVKWRYWDNKWNKYIWGHSKGHLGKKHSFETRKKMSEKKQGENNPYYGKKHSEETKRKLSTSKLGQTGYWKNKKIPEEAKRKMSVTKLGKYDGENNPNWQGGLSCEPYCEIWIDKEYKQSIRDRDDNKCQNPDCWGNCDFNCDFSLHHINYIKKDCHPKNIITVCRGCNARANFNRKEWSNFYQNIMAEKYGYDYN